MDIERYIRLQTLEINTYILDAPVEIDKGALLLDTKTKTVILQLRFNILDHVNKISSVKISIKSKDDEGNYIEGFNPFKYSYSNVDLMNNKSFGDKIPIVLDPSIRKVDVEIEKVVLKNGNVWQNSGAEITPPKQAGLFRLPRELFQQFERDIDGQILVDDKKGFIYIPQEFEEYWLCTCGRPNTNNALKCCKCGNIKKIVFEITNEENLKKNLETHLELIRQREEKQKRIEEEKRKIEEEKRRIEEDRRILLAKRNKKIWTIRIILLLIGVVLYLSIFHLYPYLKYIRASNLLTNKDYESAILQFQDLGDYKNSKQMINEVNYQKAIDLVYSQKYDDSIAIFTNLGDYKDSKEFITATKFQKAVDLLAQKKYDDSIAIFSSLGNDEKYTEYIKEAKYQKAQDFLSSSKYDETIQTLLDLADYKNSKELLRETKYQKANKLFSEKIYTEAYEYFADIGNYRDAENLLKETKYLLAMQNITGSKYDEAIKLLNDLSGYKDSDIQLTETKYLLAMQNIEGSKYDEAMKLLKDLVGYKDSDSLLTETKYLFALQNIKGSKFNEAIKLLKDLGGYKDSRDLLFESNYQYAKQLYETNIFNKSLSIFNELGNYMDTGIYQQKISLIAKMGSNAWVGYDGTIIETANDVLIYPPYSNYPFDYDKFELNPEFNSSITIMTFYAKSQQFTYNGSVLINNSTGQIYSIGRFLDFKLNSP